MYIYINCKEQIMAKDICNYSLSTGLIKDKLVSFGK